MFLNIFNNLFSKKRIIDENSANNKNTDSKNVEVDKDCSVDSDVTNSEVIRIPPNNLLKIMLANEKHSNIGSENYSFKCKNSSINLIDLITRGSQRTNKTRVNSDSLINKLNEQSNFWKPPSFHGIRNCNKIIPEYYFNELNIRNGVLDISYYDIIKDDIRNMRKLNTYQIQYIKNLHGEDKDEIIMELIKSLDSANEYINLLKSNVPSNVVSRKGSPDFDSE